MIRQLVKIEPAIWIGLRNIGASGIHHDKDSRQPEHTSGIGKGIIRFQVNEAGEPIATRPQ
jgi:hypothetical protein